jgi:hypothetical protein
MKVFVVEELDKFNETSIIGVADSLEKANGLYIEYYGNHKILNKRDIRDSGIEYEYHIECDEDRYYVIIKSFTLNKL